MKRQLHITQALMFWSCGEQYRRRYVCGEKIAPGVALITGTTVHRVNAKSMLHKKETGGLLPIEQIKDTARDAFNSEWDTRLTESGELRLTEQEEEKGLAVVKAENLDMSVALSGLYHTELAPVILPAAVEEPWVLELNNFPFDLAGTKDLQETAERGYILRDTKTSGKTPPKTKADESIQLTMYALADKVIRGGGIPPLAMDFLIKTKKPSLLTLETLRTEDHFRVLLNRIENMAECLEKEVFPPTNPDNWICSPRWCGYFASCRYVK